MIRTAKFGTAATSVYAGSVPIISTSPYNIAPADIVIAVDTTSVAVTVNLPAINDVHRRLTILDHTGSAMDHNITIHPSVGCTILGSSADVIIATPYKSVTLVSVSATDWVIVSKN